MTVTTYTTINGELMFENRGGVYTEYKPDTLGSCVRTCDIAGNTTSTTKYWPYGEVRTSTGTNPSPWSFVGLLGYLRDIAAMLYVRMRYYRPGLGRWQTVDPLWPQEKAYLYVKCHPIQSVDTIGLGNSDCYWSLIGRGILPFAACVRCSGLPYLEAYKKCRGLPIKPLPKGFRDSSDGLYAICPPNNFSEAGECCVTIATEIAGLIGLVGLHSEIPTVAACECANRCKEAMNQHSKGPLTRGDILAGFMACVSTNPNDPGFLGWLKAILEGADAL